jgi:Icc-related predicted phosphoesterase
VGLKNTIMKIWHISDTHTYHELLQIPEGIDMVIHSGDCSNPRDPYTNEPEVRRFIDWFSSLDIKYNVYLENETYEIEGIKIFGSPHTPQFGQWAFMKARHKLHRIWQGAIPYDVDIVIVHGPPKGILDLSYDRNNLMERCGDKSLMNRVMEVKPKLMLCGHIHNCKDIVNAGTRKVYGLDTIFSNGSVVTDGKFGRLSSNGNIFEL